MPTDRQHHVVSENETVGAAFSLDPLEVDGVHQVRAMDEEERRGNVLHDIPEGKPDMSVSEEPYESQWKGIPVPVY